MHYLMWRSKLYIFVKLKFIIVKNLFLFVWTFFLHFLSRSGDFVTSLLLLIFTDFYNMLCVKKPSRFHILIFLIVGKSWKFWFVEFWILGKSWKFGNENLENLGMFYLKTWGSFPWKISMVYPEKLGKFSLKKRRKNPRKFEDVNLEFGEWVFES